MNNTTRNTERLEKTLEAWTNLRPTKSFAGMTLAEFKLAVGSSLEARARLAKANKDIDEALIDRENADRLTMPVLDRVIAAVVADETEGYNGALYAALGYVRKSDRNSGLTRRAIAQATAPESAKTA
eukprot:TRINITY_DN11026_c0_g1_i1.p1 TRINITY_DN11026_c0_g1~~TRINITY_DN11026_c0_g1_i1.p1  ORF type:complete len:127 (+),score=24.57 TRINITY_DN11026_c0_g1_i1:53-433(+)